MTKTKRWWILLGFAGLAVALAIGAGAMADKRVPTISWEIRTPDGTRISSEQTQLDVLEGSLDSVIFTCSWNPPADNPIAITSVSLPAGATMSACCAGINSVSCTLVYVPDFCQSGLRTVEWLCGPSCGVGNSQIFSFNVINSNRPPVLTTFPTQTVYVPYCGSVQIPVGGTDPDFQECSPESGNKDNLSLSLLAGDGILTDNGDGTGVLDVDFSPCPIGPTPLMNLPQTILISDGQGGSDSSAIPLVRLPPVQFQQVDFMFNALTIPDSRHGLLSILDPAALLTSFGVSSGYVNVYTDRGWVVQNNPLDMLDLLGGGAPFTLYFDLEQMKGDVTSLSAHIDVSSTPSVTFSDGPRAIYPVGTVEYNAEGAWAEPDDFVISVGNPPAPGGVVFNPAGATERHTQPSAPNVEAARNQCVPMAVANSLQYLEDEYGLPIPHDHKKGLRGDNSLVGHLGEYMQRLVLDRDSGLGVAVSRNTFLGGGRGMVAGKFVYLRKHGLNKRLIHEHQGTENPAGLRPPGDFTFSGVTTSDSSVAGKVTFEWLSEKIKNGEDVELVYGYYFDTGDGEKRHGGHCVRVFECGKIAGVPYIRYLHDRLQTGDTVGADTIGSENVFTFLFDSDGDGNLNLRNVEEEVDFALSESADNDMDGVPQKLDNAPTLWNPGQEDADHNGIGDVLESPFLREDSLGPILTIPAGGSSRSGFFANPNPPDPDHKDIWFVGTAQNNSADTARVSISFDIKDGATLTSLESGDTTEIPPSLTREIFGGLRVDHCPDSVRVVFKSNDAEVSNLSGVLSHICYALGSCCVTTGDFDHNGSFNIGDVTAGIARIFGGGPPPFCQDEADANGDNSFNIGDVTYGIARIFSGGPAPVCGTTGT